MIEPYLIPTTPWGNRTELLPKQARYLLSLDLAATASSPFLISNDQQKRALRHLFDETTATVPEGVLCELPRADIRRVTGQIGTAADPSSPNLSLDVAATFDDGAAVNISCTGVVLFRGGPAALRSAGTSIGGSAFVATNYETTSATYRWMTRRQLFGVGTVRGKRASSGRAWRLDFTFDLYGAF
jgi:hypothetical protein